MPLKASPLRPSFWSCLSTLLGRTREVRPARTYLSIIPGGEGRALETHRFYKPLQVIKLWPGQAVVDRVLHGHPYARRHPHSGRVRPSKVQVGA